MKENDEFEVVFALRSENWGKGLATEAARGLLRITFEVAQGLIPHIAALVFPQNLRSIAVLTKLGMEFQGHHFDRATQRYACLYRATEKQFFDALHLTNSQSSSK